MRRLPVLLAALLVLSVSVPASAESWTFDAAHSAVQFKVRHLMVSSVRGDFEKVSGAIHYDEKDVTRSRAEIAIDAKSIDTRVAQRDDHLRSADFLDVAKYPTITFISKRVEKAGEGRLKVTGDLTLHGVTKEVVLDVEGPTPPIRDMQGNLRVGGQATARIHRKDFGLTWNKALETGGVVVGDEVDITIDLEIYRKPG
jgi:polyisoprenoid-binding protein YceI